LLVANWPFCINKFDLIWFDSLCRWYTTSVADSHWASEYAT